MDLGIVEGVLFFFGEDNIKKRVGFGVIKQEKTWNIDAILS